jgi:hypothetical protein
MVFYFRSKANYYIRVFKRIAIYGGLGLILLLISNSTLVGIYYGENPEYVELYKKVLADPDDKDLQYQLIQMKEEMYWQEESENKIKPDE